MAARVLTPGLYDGIRARAPRNAKPLNYVDLQVPANDRGRAPRAYVAPLPGKRTEPPPIMNLTNACFQSRIPLPRRPQHGLTISVNSTTPNADGMRPVQGTRLAPPVKKLSNFAVAALTPNNFGALPGRKI